MLVGIPFAAARFDDPGRLLWIAAVPVLIVFAGLGLAREPLRIVVTDSGIEVNWLTRTRTLERPDLVAVITPKRTYLFGESVVLKLKNGEKVELPNRLDRVLTALRSHYPEVPVDRSDSGYLSS